MDRKLELVTPPGSMADIQISSTAVTPDGETVCFSTEDDMAGSVTNGNKTTLDGFCARRGSEGWVTRWETGPAPEVITGTSGAEVWAVSTDGEKVLFTSDMNLYPDWFRTDGTGKGGNDSTYLRNGDSLRWLTPGPTDPALWDAESRVTAMSGGANIARGPLALTQDLGYGVFESSLRLLPEDTNDVVDTYMWTPTGFELVSHDPDGAAIGGRAPIRDFSQMFAPAGTISDNGARVFFERLNGYGGIEMPDAPAGVYSIYLREGGVATPLPVRQGGDTPANVRFEAATGDGNTVFLSSTERLTLQAKESGNAIYAYDVDDDEVTPIATESGGVEFLGTSKDGSTVVYRTVAAPMELRLLRGGTAITLGNLHADDLNVQNGWVGSPRLDKRALRITDDGTVVAFVAAGTFTEPNPDAWVQAYRWAEGEGLERISAPPGDGPATGHSSLGNPGSLIPVSDGSRYKAFQPIRSGGNLGAAMSRDGSRVFFETSQRLVDADVNDVVDVYEWHQGEVSLISPGTQKDHALYHDNSEDGSTVFFTTRSALIPQLDRNSLRDLYAMREGGGFPLPDPAVPCSGDACQGVIPPHGPSAATPGSATVSGDGNVLLDRTRNVNARVRAPRRVRGSAVNVRVKVSSPGRIAATGRGVRGVSRRAGRSGTYRLRVKLKPAGRRALKRRGAFATTVRVRFSPRSGRAVTRRIRVRFSARAQAASLDVRHVQPNLARKEAR